jgi:DNA-binding CsgD family transcriptional regulator
MQDDVLSNAELSVVVGTIYDCALDPKRWPDAIREVCRVSDCIAGTIDVSDLSTSSLRLHQYWNFDPQWLDHALRYYGAEVAEFWAGMPNLMTRPLDHPLSVMREHAERMALTRYYDEWVRPHGYVDCIALMVLRERNRLGALSLTRHESVGVADDHALGAVRLLAPHVRRAVAISDVLNMQAIKLGTFESAFDLLQAGVVIVDSDCKIFHANRAAAAMLEAQWPIHAAHGELRTRLPQATAALKKAVAVRTEPAIGALGIGVPLPQPDGDPAHIHVLPLKTGTVRPRLAPRASAALFITTREGGGGPPAEAIAAIFDLTLAEIRTVERLLAGRSPAEIADDLGLALPTVRTHLAKIFAKTGTSRQSDLILLASQLAAPVRPVVRTD